MSQMNEKYQEHFETLKELVIPADYIEYCVNNISQRPYDIVELMMLAEFFDKTVIRDYIENIGFVKSVDHYELLLAYEPKYFDLFMNNDQNEMISMMDVCFSKPTLISEYVQKVALHDSFYYTYFVNKYNVSELSAYILGNQLFIDDKNAFYLFNLFKIPNVKDAELELFAECTDEKTTIDVILMPRQEQINIVLKPETKKSYSAVFENVSSLFLSASKSLMSQSGKIALTSVMVMGVMASAHAGEAKKTKSFDEKIAIAKEILQDAQAQLQNSPGGKDCVLEIKEATHNKVSYSIKITLGDEEKIINDFMAEAKNNNKVISSVAEKSVFSKKTGKCQGLAGDSSFQEMKQTIVKSLSKL